jgi:Zn-dependent peptidase ImmA (M78 family)
MGSCVLFEAYLQRKAADAASHLKSAVSKIFGIYDGVENEIHIDHTVHPSKQTFLKFHETGHHFRRIRSSSNSFRDCEKTLSPEIADLFKREANNFARFVLFQGDKFSRMAADCKFEIRTPIKLAKKFGASAYAKVAALKRLFGGSSRHCPSSGSLGNRPTWSSPSSMRSDRYSRSAGE